MAYILTSTGWHRLCPSSHPGVMAERRRIASTTYARADRPTELAYPHSVLETM
jgi:hypothetical protein